MGKSKSKKVIDWPVLIISGGFLILFVIGSLINSELSQIWWINLLIFPLSILDPFISFWCWLTFSSLSF